MRAYAWPGNVRELRNVLERALLRAEEKEIHPSDFRFAPALAESPAGGGGQTLIDLEKQQIERVLSEEHGRVVQAAQRLGIPRSTLYQKIKGFRVDLARFQR